MTRLERRGCLGGRWCAALALSWAVAAMPAGVSAAEGEPAKATVALPYLALSPLPVKECTLTIAAGPLAPTPLPAASGGSPPWTVWVAAGVVAVVALLALLAVLSAAKAMRRMRLDAEISKLALREMEFGRGPRALLRASCELVLGVRGDATQTDPDVEELRKACARFLERSKPARTA